MKKIKIKCIDILCENWKLHKLIKRKEKTIAFLSSAVTFYYKETKRLQEELNNFTKEDIK